MRSDGGSVFTTIKRGKHGPTSLAAPRVAPLVPPWNPRVCFVTVGESFLSKFEDSYNLGIDVACVSLITKNFTLSIVVFGCKKFIVIRDYTLKIFYIRNM